MLEIFDEQRALVYWFTYDEDGDQRWLIGDGQIGEDDSGWYIAFPDMYLTRGPAFGPDFDASSVQIEVVGDGKMRFSGCDKGLFQFEGLGQELVFPIQRLTRIMGADCSAPLHGRPGEPLQPYAGQSGSWFEPDSSGQGVALQWMPDDTAVVVWFTYDGDGEQQWMLGVGELEGDHLVFPDLESTRGGRFGEDFDPDQVQRLHWGDLELELSCSGGRARYSSDRSGFGNGELELVPLSRLMRPAACPAEVPEIERLYDLAYVEIPVRNEGEDYSSTTEVKHIAKGGTVAGVTRHTLKSQNSYRLFPAGESEWQSMEDNGFSALLFFSVDGMTAAFNYDHGWTDEGSRRTEPKLWLQESGVMPLPGQNFSRALVRGGSTDGRCLVGTGRVEMDFGEPIVPWRWMEEYGQQELPTHEGVGGGTATPLACSSDARIVIGNQLLDENGWRQDIAIRWVGDAEPELLYDSEGARLRFAQACNADCSLIVGGDQVDLDPDHPNYREPWYWTEAHGAVYLGMPTDAHLVGMAPATAWDVSSDGSVIVGSYVVENPWDEPSGTRAFIWTEATGLVVVPDLLAANDLGDTNWSRMAAVSVAKGSDDIWVLLSGSFRNPPESGLYDRRAAILHLSPRHDSWFD
ncbi:hypothetical protein IC757_03415 [Wenzhouxiangella sp. AB-CW3]|uniref:hypothetical protein n=1 Tax=Wenzhouxiangella sp. AB-CW3 TaxID=2771012 RepID=UPI00168A41BD|nr:hypothetical protein [Wenzhouxiangella sp. AB-CW3]QOC23214.1 hypothetical protein IC757_03415 [Wenzhouxiangella sp. AB-CW3]